MCIGHSVFAEDGTSGAGSSEPTLPFCEGIEVIGHARGTGSLER